MMEWETNGRREYEEKKNMEMKDDAQDNGDEHEQHDD
jgi:hypothetical protein